MLAGRVGGGEKRAIVSVGGQRHRLPETTGAVGCDERWEVWRFVGLGWRRLVGAWRLVRLGWWRRSAGRPSKLGRRWAAGWRRPEVEDDLCQSSI